MLNATEYIGITVGSPGNVGTKFFAGASNLVVSLILFMARKGKRESGRGQGKPLIIFLYALEIRESLDLQSKVGFRQPHSRSLIK